MAWVVDASVLLDIRLNDPVFGLASATCLSRHLGDGSTLCPVTCAELAPAFKGDAALQQSFLRQVGVNGLESWQQQDAAVAFQLWDAHIRQKRAGHVGKRPVADIFIAAFATRFQGIVTRNPKHFASVPSVVP